MEKWHNVMPKQEVESLRNEVFYLLRKTMRPEFLNRIDEIVLFKPLTKSQIKEIVVIQLESLKKLLGLQNIHIDIEQKAIEYLSEHGFDPQLGARPVKRLIQREIVNVLSKEIISGRITRDSSIIIGIDKGGICFRNKEQ